MKYVIDIPDFDKYNMPSPTKGRIVSIPITIGDTTFDIPTEMTYIEPYTELDRDAIEQEIREKVAEEVWNFAGELMDGWTEK